MGYKKDLAYIHDEGFGTFSKRAAPGLLAHLRKAGIRRGLVVDLGCGSGIWAAELARAGYEVFGIDISSAMIRMTRAKVPSGKFKIASLLTAPLPRCAAVTSLGECLNYTFDPANTPAGLSRLFRRIYQALEPGGLFIFDVLLIQTGELRKHRERSVVGRDWAVLLELTASSGGAPTLQKNHDISKRSRKNPPWRRAPPAQALLTE